MQYLISLSPILFLFISISSFKRKEGTFLDTVKFIEGKDHVVPKDCRIYELALILFKLRKLYGPKVQTALRDLKSESLNLNREMKRIQSLKKSAYLQQSIMIALITVMISISKSMFEEIEIPVLELVLLQILSLLILWSLQKILHKYLALPSIVRFRLITTLNCLYVSGLSISKVLAQLDWESLDKSKSKHFRDWDALLLSSLKQWKLTGSGLEVSVLELREELSFLRETQTKRFHELMEASKFISLIVSGFLSYFLFLFSFLGTFLS